MNRPPESAAEKFVVYYPVSITGLFKKQKALFINT
jgi:hypothetical protein